MINYPCEIYGLTLEHNAPGWKTGMTRCYCQPVDTTSNSWGFVNG